MNGEYKPFSVREGYAEQKPVQKESIDRDLRVGLWNAFYELLGQFPLGYHSYFEEVDVVERDIFEYIWIDFIKEPVDEFEEPSVKSLVRNIFLDENENQFEDWFYVYDLVECIVKYGPLLNYSETRNEFISQCNAALIKENSAYRIINGIVAPVTNEQEIKSIEEASSAPYEGARKHIKQSLALFADRENPDYPNSIKEAISAVESLSKEVAGEDKGTLGDLVKKLPLQHPAFNQALSKLYGFTSDVGGIRHGSKPKEDLPIDESTARFMLVICSAFVNYIISQDTELNR